MSGTVSYIMEMTFVILLLTWALVNARSFSAVIKSASDAVVGSVNAIWHR